MYKYIGSGFIVGIPARDIPRAEFETFDKETQNVIKSCGLYEFVKVKADKAAEES